MAHCSPGGDQIVPRAFSVFALAASVAALVVEASRRGYDGRVMASPRTRRFIGYPAGSLLAVLPGAESAAATAAALRAASRSVVEPVTS